MSTLLSRCRWLLVGVATATAAAQDLVRPEAHPGGVLLVVRDGSGLVTNDSPLYLASNRGGWNPGDTSMRLSGRSDLRWQILLPGPVGEPPLAFKFTRGSWDTVEVAPDLSDVPNRTLEPVPAGEIDPTKPLVVELEIARFADERPAASDRGGAEEERAANITGEVRRVQVIGGASIAAGLMRDVLVWLPPGYDDPANADMRYPTLYLQDGQNVFDFSPPTPGEWGADETATALINAGEIEPVIIVGIPHSRRGRFAEYMPSAVRAGARVDAQGDAYVRWLMGEVVPRVERAFRADPEARGIGGSSLGALVALRAAQLYPDEFEFVLAESPSLILRGADLTEAMTSDLEPSARRYFIGVGEREIGDDLSRSAELVAAVRALAERLSVAGVVRLEIDPDAGHNEQAWAGRLPAAMRFFYSGD